MPPYTDEKLGLDQEAASASSSYPPSPSYLSEEPAWVHQDQTAKGTLRQRVFDLFESKPSIRNARGYSAVGEHHSSGGSGFGEVMRKLSHKKLVQLVCLLFVLGGTFALFSSTPTPDPAAAGAFLNPGKAAQAVTSTGTSHSPSKTTYKVNLGDKQCQSVLKGGAEAIACHIKLAQRKFDGMISRQSKTYKQAVARYVQQNGRQPPPGFQDWYRFAVENKAVIIDDYGQLDKDLEPLRKIPGHVQRERIKSARKTGMWLLHQWDFKDGSVTTSAPGNWENVAKFREIMSPFLHKLPEFSVLHSWDDSHRVCGPKDGVEDVNDELTIQIGTSGIPSSREYLTQGCPRNTETASLVTSDRPSVDICSHSHDWETKHGIFHVQNGCFNSTVPVLSLAKVSSFQDITTASWCYASESYRLFGDKKDTFAYADKKPHLYWRGSNTGSRYDGKYAYAGHRQRLVMYAHQLKTKAVQLASRAGASSFTEDDKKRFELTNMPKSFTNTQLSAISKLKNETFDINFVNLHGCDSDPKFCQEWKSKIPLATRQPSSYAFENKFLMDLDGNSMSCRFYRLLDSNSLVFKQTIYVEWHDDRIIPWLHYIPVSRGMEELPILLDYFANHPEGQRMGAEIAEASRVWAATALRKIDLSIYTYRQMIELAHIIGHD